jgi:hypothetical protein
VSHLVAFELDDWELIETNRVKVESKQCLYAVELSDTKIAIGELGGVSIWENFKIQL